MRAGSIQSFAVPLLEQFGDQHRGSIILLISSGAAKITEALSPIIPAGVIAGAPFSGLSAEVGLEPKVAFPEGACLSVRSRHAIGVVAIGDGLDLPGWLDFCRLGSLPPIIPPMPPIIPSMPFICA